MTVMYCKLTITYNCILPSVYMFRITGRWKRDLRTIGRAGVTVFSVPCNRKVASWNLPEAIALRTWTSCPPTIVCEEGIGKPPYSSHSRVTQMPLDFVSCIHRHLQRFEEMEKCINCERKMSTSLKDRPTCTNNGTRWYCGMFCALQAEGRRLESTSSHRVSTLENCLPQLSVKQRETISLVSSPSGVKFTGPTMVTRIHRHHHQ